MVQYQIKVVKLVNKAYLTKMREDKVVQFVCFETKLSPEQFIIHWEQYTRSVNSDLDVILQQSEKNSLFKYIAQHRFPAGELQFVFEKARRSSRTPEVEIKARQAGGYSILQSQRTNDAHEDESKIFVFLVHSPADLNTYKQLSAHSKLNIYEAYYENCKYACILEFFVKDKYAANLLEQVKLHTSDEIGVYKECVLNTA